MVSGLVRAKNVTVTRLTLVRVEVEVVSNSVGAVVFEDTMNGEVSVETKAFVNCTPRGVDSRLFNVLDPAGIVFDGRVVVDSKFQTNDPNVFAGGAICKYSRQYGLGVYHEHLNGNELGPMVAGAVLSSCFLGEKGQAMEREATLPEYQMGASISVSLFHGKLHYTHAATAQTFADEFIDDSAPECRKLITRVNRQGGTSQFTQLVTDAFGNIVSAMTAGPMPVDAVRLEALVGLHVSYLGDVPERCDSGALACLTHDFLQSAEAEVFVHDRFREMRRVLRADVREAVDEAIARLSTTEGGADEAEKGRVTRNAARRAVFQHMLAFVQTQANDVPAHVIPMGFQTHPGLVN